MMSVTLVILFYAFCANAYLTPSASCNLDGYYWREFYGGKVPQDAFVAGQDLNNENVYIGQVYVDDGLFVGYLQANVKEVKVPIKGVKTVDNNIKVLCGDPQDFKWLKTNASHVHLDLIGLKPVIGGFERNLGTIYIGRISVDGSLKIGKVNGFNVGSAFFFYANKDSEHGVIPSYEVLTYKSHAGDIDTGILE